ncbi:DUF4198 domain-containing protein [Pseudorhodoplanes sp.]|uniref:DUF4198 domain-containing protein n=1 Tax=Pseudorhodoplanes sp. TaxID=1934341 RepID=UPI002BDFCCD8|nr:DUF4198 domain-containing protein [Pseudorhodoplanes sp.]HWV54032.1 DUF4198 domain-containing protein [Pseudorhodoplanes sp.]
MKFSRTCLVVALCLGLPLTAQAHRSWMLPSATVLSGDDVWVTVDAAVSNDLFYFEHFPLRLANIGSQETSGPRGGRPAVLTISAPDGSKVEPQNGSVGRYRSTFDVPLKQKGTYKLAVVNDGIFASYKDGAQTKRWRGSAEDFAKEVPQNAQDLRASFNQSRMEVFVTAGKPTTETLKTVGSGLELAPITHPNDLVVGTDATFRMLLDGKPAPNLKVTVIPGGNRYRDKLGEMTLTTDAEGKFTVKWPEPGMYWMEAVVQDDNSPAKEVKRRRAAYIATLEVLPQ